MKKNQEFKTQNFEEVVELLVKFLEHFESKQSEI